MTELKSTQRAHLSDDSIKQFSRLTNALLLITLLGMVIGFLWTTFGDDSTLAIRIIKVSVMAALISTPIRLLSLSVALRRDGSAKLGGAALVLVLILALAAALKWIMD